LIWNLLHKKSLTSEKLKSLLNFEFVSNKSQSASKHPWDPNSLYPPIYFPLRELLKKLGQNYFNENSISLRKFTNIILLSSVTYAAFCQRAEFEIKANLSPNIQ
jgi:hypothetical protein